MSRREVFQSEDPDAIESMLEEEPTPEFSGMAVMRPSGEIDYGAFETWLSTHGIGTRDAQELAGAVKAMAHHRKEREEIDKNIRLMFELKLRHLVGMPIHAIIGVIDGLLESGAVGVSEVAETATFLVSRTQRRMREGWRRGKDG